MAMRIPMERLGHFRRVAGCQADGTRLEKKVAGLKGSAPRLKKRIGLKRSVPRLKKVAPACRSWGWRNLALPQPGRACPEALRHLGRQALGRVPGLREAKPRRGGAGGRLLKAKTLFFGSHLDCLRSGICQVKSSRTPTPSCDQALPQ